MTGVGEQKESGQHEEWTEHGTMSVKKKLKSLVHISAYRVEGTGMEERGGKVIMLESMQQVENEEWG